MARALTHSLPSTTLEAAIRTHFGLSQAELGRYLGTSAAYVGHLEGGRRRASRRADHWLTRLGDLLPPPEGQGPAAPPLEAQPLPATPPAGDALPTGWQEEAPLLARPLRQRYQQVAAQASGLRLLLRHAARGVALHRRRQWGLGVLQAALPGWEVSAPERAHLDRWLATLAADVAADATATPAAATARALHLTRLLALDAEAATLLRLLGET